MTTAITYGPDVPDESDLRLCGDVEGKRVVELGLNAGTNAVAFAARGAKAMAVDPSAERVAAARREAEANDVHVEFHQGELADLGFATSASVDLVFSNGALATVDDLSRVFRQVHRVLKPGAALVFSMPHPIAAMLEGGEVVLRKPYWATGTRTASDVFMALSRANFQIDVIVEPAPTGHPSALVPAALVMRARKLGV
ncbi:MAG TPA: class I SAM-dependent methyltransferase [Acidimicrobiales bacterium]|nr:class I SAM-dependent methyltransferase [Acidimicrobiales bacterium]